jgi:glycosyltransferase involved in cell wall biosynthesis
MRVLYFSGPSFFDLDLSFVKRLSSRVDCYFFLDLYPKLHKATALDINTPIQSVGILPISSFPELNIYSGYLDFRKTFVINRVSNNPLAISNLILQWRLLRFVRELQPEVVHFNNFIYFNHFYLFLCGGKKLISIHDPLPHSGDENSFSSAIPRLTRFINNKCVRNHLLFNRAMVDAYRDASQLDTTNILTSSLGVYDYLNLFTADHANNDSDILFFGRIAAYKGVDVLLSAFQEILKKMPDTVLTIAGAGNFGFDIASYGFPPARLKIINRYIPNGELAQLIRGTKLVVCPYKDATQSGVIMTAFAFAKPVIATNVGGLVEMVEDGATGRLVPPNDPKSLAQAIVGLLRDEAKRMQIEHNIRSVYWDGEKSWDKIIDRLVTIYAELD